MMRLRYSLTAIPVLFAGCQTGAVQATPAYLADTSPEAVFLLPGQVAEALTETNVKLGPLSETEPSVITVLPPQGTALQGNNPALPRVFDLVLNEDRCFLKERASGETFALSDVSCLPLSR
ncbi:MAG: hypothetical protein AAGH90_06885 [Pseudomonadota bacterium]